METKLRFILLLAIVSASIGISDASIRSNQDTVYIGGNPPDIIEEPTEYLLTTSDIDIQAEISNTQIRNGTKDGGFTCKPAKVDAGYYGYYNEPNYCEGKTIVQSISTPNNHMNAWIIGLHPSVSEYDAILQNIKDIRSIGSNYKATFENLPQLADRSFFIPTTIVEDNSGYEDTVVVQSGNIIVIISGSTVGESKNSKEFLIDYARKYLSKIAQVKSSLPNLIIQATTDKTVLEVGEYYNSGDRFNIEFKSTVPAFVKVINNGIIDSFVLEHSESRSYIADKVNGTETIEITGITAKGKTDTTQLHITTISKATPVPPTPMQTPIKQSSGFDVSISVFSIAVSLIIRVSKKGKI